MQETHSGIWELRGAQPVTYLHEKSIFLATLWGVHSTEYILQYTVIYWGDL